MRIRKLMKLQVFIAVTLLSVVTAGTTTFASS